MRSGTAIYIGERPTVGSRPKHREFKGGLARTTVGLRYHAKQTGEERKRMTNAARLRFQLGGPGGTERGTEISSLVIAGYRRLDRARRGCDGRTHR